MDAGLIAGRTLQSRCPYRIQASPVPSRSARGMNGWTNGALKLNEEALRMYPIPQKLYPLR